MLRLTSTVDRAILAAPTPLPVNVGIYFDPLAAVMNLLIATVGLVIARFSVQSLDGEAGQGRFFKWLAFTIGSVLVLVVARNLLMFTVAWMLTSLGLHKLLLQYADRPWAVWAARHHGGPNTGLGAHACGNHQCRWVPRDPAEPAHLALSTSRHVNSRPACGGSPHRCPD
ncbi:MAG: hypothetical protein O3A37_09090 [Planctomycetota bacterium]|nr:hypothetical protein [Planctomycetota bacterium]